jgi:shikimate dehydrogenase
MDKTAGKELYGLIGYPVKHSFSAFMHNAAFAHYRLNAEYQLFEVAPEHLRDFFQKTIPGKKIKGFNITVPHKENAYAYFLQAKAKIDSSAQRVKAINTVVVKRNGSLIGFNTDGAGFMEDLKEHHREVKNRNISLIGAGGGAKAVALAMALSIPKRFLVFDVDKKRSVELVALIKEQGCHAQAVDSLEELRIQEAEILVNATPVGMKESDPPLIKQEWLHHQPFVYDLIYNPAETKLLKMAKEAGCPCANGLGMLLYQGCLAFEKWAQKKAPVDVMRRALLERLNG